MFLKARKLHRFMVIIISLLALIMMFTGSVMKYPSLFTFIDPFAARRLHNTISPLFSITLFLMAATGLTMYLYPYFRKHKSV
jgi:hypothetical protein